MKWFSCDNYGCMTLHASAVEAKAAAEADLEWCRDQASEAWPEETGRICWGEVREMATHRVVHTHDAECRNEDGRLACDGSRWNETWEYDLTPPAPDDSGAETPADKARRWA
jgi:hypothetical protein